MLFPTPVFLFLFLPALLSAYHLGPRRARNALLLAGSLLFYAWGEGPYLGLLVGSVLANFVLGRILGATEDGSTRRRWLTLGVLANLAVLGWFKYAAFLRELAIGPARLLGLHLPALGPVVLPLGISFFTFQILSYLVDVAQGRCRPQQSLGRLMLYVTMFPQLVAGPIVRYQDLEPQLGERSVDLAAAADGARRFVVGLAKKVLIADQVGRVADAAYMAGPGGLTTSLAWVGAVAYAIQIYFDFSGYSDMAIGLGQLFGMRFPENFRHPYVARSMRDFWRRWHISLSTWFRDYLYIPLGGSRVSRVQTARNLLVTFFLCGLWHGASWRFVVWGLYHGLFLSLERSERVSRALGEAPRPLAHLYVVLVVLVGWVFFRATSLAHAGRFLWALVDGAPNGPWPVDAGSGLALVVGVLASVPWPPPEQIPRGAKDLALLGLLVLALIEVGASTHQSFLYFHF